MDMRPEITVSTSKAHHSEHIIKVDGKDIRRYSFHPLRAVRSGNLITLRIYELQLQ